MLHYSLPRTALLERVFTCGWILLALNMMPDPMKLNFFVVLGIGHIFLGFIAQTRAGIIQPHQWWFLALGAAYLFWIGYKDPRMFFIAAGLTFAFHVFLDEYVLEQQPVTLPRLFLMIATAIAIYGLTIDDMYPKIMIEHEMAYAAIIVFVMATLIAWKQGKRTVCVTDLFIASILAFMVFILLTPYDIYVHSGLAFVSVSHYSHWYVELYQRYRQTPAKLRRFAKEALIIHMLLLAGYAATRLVGSWNWLEDYFYTQVAFFVWATLHVMITFDRNQLRQAFTLR